MAKRRSILQRLQFAWKEFFDNLPTGSRFPVSIPSVLGESEGFLVDPNQLRTRRMEATILSVAAHASIVLLALLLVQKGNGPLPTIGKVVMINTPFFDLPNNAQGEGGGGGGGGRREQAPQAWGGMPDATQLQLLPPDPEEPQPLVPVDAMAASVVMPLDIAHDQSLPIGDLSAPFNNSSSHGPGGPDGLGDGEGTGVGPGKGPGYGPGKNGGFGGGEDGTIGKGGNGVYPLGIAGLKYPELLFDPKPAYTEEARKSRVEGIVLIQAIVRKDGAVDSFKVLRGLGHGLDESAIQTIGTKWRFRPARLNGVPVDLQITIEVSFRLF